LNRDGRRHWKGMQTRSTGRRGGKCTSWYWSIS
jgi:hypothetical protein